MMANSRTKGNDIAKVTVARLAISATPFEQTPNEQLVGELAMQRDVLLTKLSNNKSQ